MTKEILKKGTKVDAFLCKDGEVIDDCPLETITLEIDTYRNDGFIRHQGKEYRIYNDPLFEFRSSGGKARAKTLTPERRKEIAMMGVEAKKNKRLSTDQLASKE